MRTALFLCLSFVLYSSIASAAIGWLKVKIVSVNDKHTAQATFRMNGLSGNFSHSTPGEPTWAIEKGNLNQGTSTPISIAYSFAAAECEFDFILSFRSGEVGQFINLGQFHAPTGARGASIPLGTCGSHFCSSDPTISRELKKNRINEIRVRERARKETLLTKWRSSKPDSRAFSDADYRRKQLDAELNSARRALVDQQRELKSRTEPLAHVEESNQSLLETLRPATESNISDPYQITENLRLGPQVGSYEDYLALKDLWLAHGLLLQHNGNIDRLKLELVPPTVSELAIRLAPGFGLAIDIQEALTGVFAVGPNRGREMPALDRTFAVLGAATLGYGSKAKQGVAEIRVAAKNLRFDERLVAAGERYGIKTKEGMKVFYRIESALETLPSGRNLERIREGTDASKIAIIGKGMSTLPRDIRMTTDTPGIYDIAEYFGKKGIRIETFDDPEAFKAFANLKKSIELRTGNPRAMIPANEVIKTELFRSNVAWAEKLKKEGYTVLDFGYQEELSEFSVFYAAEKKILF